MTRPGLFIAAIGLLPALLAGPLASAQGLLTLHGLEEYQLLIEGFAPRGPAASEAMTQVIASYERGDYPAASAEIDTLIAEMRRSRDRVGEAAAMDLRGLLAQRQGRLQEALDDHDYAIRMFEPEGAVGQAALLNAKNNRAIAHYFRGEYREAQALLAEVLDNPALPPPGRARALNNRGLIHQELGTLEQARHDFDAAKSAAGDDQRLRAEILNNQARVYGAEGHVQAAVRELQAAQRLARELGDPVLEANVLDTWAEGLLAVGEAAAALHKIEEAQERQADAPTLLLRVTLATNRGRVLAVLGRSQEALTALNDAVTLAAGAKLDAWQRRALSARGDVYRQVGWLGQAIADYQEAIALGEATHSRLLHETQAAFRRATQHTYESLVTTLLTRGEPGDHEQALVYLDRTELAALHQVLVTTRPELRDKDIERRIRGTQDLLSDEATLATYLQQELAAPSPRGEVVARIQDWLRDLRQRVAEAVAEIVNRYDPSYSPYVTIPQTFVGLKEQLPAGRLLVTFFPAEDRLYLFLVSKDAGVEFRQNPQVSRRQLETHIYAYRQAVGPAASWTDPQWARLRVETAWLYQALLQPIAAELARAEQVIFAPTGLLYYLPLHALGPVDAQTGALRFLIQDKPVSYITSTTLGRVAVGLGKPRPRSLLALGNPPFRHEKLKPLPHAEEEVKDLAKEFGAEAVPLTGPDATRQALFARLGASERVAAGGGALPGEATPSRPGFGFVHLATHGIVDQQRPVDSWLALDGTNKLVAREVPRLDLRDATLVTLSACETALGQERPGVELMSLATFFGQAGAPSIVVSLWPVDDRATRELMVAFYRGLVGPNELDKAKALQGAQAALVRTPEMRHPYYWAPFILIGDWR